MEQTKPTYTIYSDSSICLYASSIESWDYNILVSPVYMHIFPTRMYQINIIKINLG